MKFGVEDLRVPESGAEVLNCPRVEDKVRILAGGFDGHVVKPSTWLNCLKRYEAWWRHAPREH